MKKILLAALGVLGVFCGNIAPAHAADYVDANYNFQEYIDNVYVRNVYIDQQGDTSMVTIYYKGAICDRYHNLAGTVKVAFRDDVEDTWFVRSFSLDSSDENRENRYTWNLNDVFFSNASNTNVDVLVNSYCQQNVKKPSIFVYQACDLTVRKPSGYVSNGLAELRAYHSNRLSYAEVEKLKRTKQPEIFEEERQQSDEPKNLFLVSRLLSFSF